MRILYPPGNSNWLQVYDDLASLPNPPASGSGSVAVVQDNGSGNFAGMLWNGSTWVEAFGPSIVESVSSNLRKHNFAATSNPAVTNDVDEGYSVGSRWVNLTVDYHYVCTDSTSGAAVWKRTDGGGGGGGTFLTQKAGIVLASTFAVTSNYMQATVTFSTAFADSNYSVAIGVQSDSVSDNRFLPSIVSRTASAFTISLGTASKTGLTAVSWVATAIGESS